MFLDFFYPKVWYHLHILKYLKLRSKLFLKRMNYNFIYILNNNLQRFRVNDKSSNCKSLKKKRIPIRFRELSTSKKTI